MCVFVCLCICMCTCLHLHVCVHTYVCMCVCVFIFVCIHSQIYILQRGSWLSSGFPDHYLEIWMLTKSFRYTFKRLQPSSTSCEGKSFTIASFLRVCTGLGRTYSRMEDLSWVGPTEARFQKTKMNLFEYSTSRQRWRSLDTRCVLVFRHPFVLLQFVTHMSLYSDTQNTNIGIHSSGVRIANI